MRIFIADEAKAYLLQIDSYIAERNPVAADSIAEAINKKFDNLRHFPFIGAVEENRLTIVRVLDGRRDINAEFLR